MINFSTRKYFVFVFALLILLSGATIFNIYSDYSGFNVPSRIDSIVYFYHLQSGFVSVAVLFLYYASFPFIYSYHVIDAKNTTFQNLIVTRSKSKRKYYFHILVTNAFYTAITVLLIKLIQLLICQLLVNPLNFRANRFFLHNQMPFVFSLNPFINLILVILFSIIGAVVFSTFVMTIGLFIRNTIIYLGMELITSLVCLLLPGTINTLLNLKSSLVISSLFLENLLQPGVASLGAYAPRFNAFLPFIGALLFYTLLTTILGFIWYKRYSEVS
ncbi:hypothetical protein [Lapidilactobacillus bayanensis]|uniref:hypothetical protein n=1 Tax=Lapidilactobacillus bayanensis TaxID=2485998 RepID=UPI000F77B5DF|nr:hypothetical protein [Lapidilactobacillus bayanensis]